MPPRPSKGSLEPGKLAGMVVLSDNPRTEAFAALQSVAVPDLESRSKESKRMNAFRTFLVAVFLVIAGYTLVVVANHGLNLLPVFFGDMTRMQWPGQFNLDFMCMLLLAGLWVSWRHRFSAAGVALGLAAVFGGALFLSAYLLIESFRTRGDVRKLLLGVGRVT
jgi:hypothetical protein